MTSQVSFSEHMILIVLLLIGVMLTGFLICLRQILLYMK
uniref:Iso3 n=1 Tax=Arundo donax TaxID=35708 RepID=A0A0A8XNJ3_ARUDO